MAAGIGLVCAVIGEAISSWPLGILATLLLIGGLIAVAVSFRRELGYEPSTSRLSLLAARAAPSRASGAASPADITLGAYAEEMRQALVTGSSLLEAGRAERDPGALELARDRVVTLVASPLYGRAISAGLIDEAEVRRVSSGFAGEA